MKLPLWEFLFFISSVLYETIISYIIFEKEVGYMSVKDLYWRELEFDNSKRYSWVFHNYAVIINAEVLIHIAKADAPAPNNDSPYFTIPFRVL